MRNSRAFTMVALAALLVFGISGSTQAAAPTWTPITGNQYTMIAFGAITYDGNPVSSGILGAFGPGGEADCRATQNLTGGNYFLTIRGNTLSNETITFKYYDPGLDAVINVEQTVNFTSDGTENINLQAVSVPGTISGSLTYIGPATGTFYVGAWKTDGFVSLDEAPDKIVAATSTYSIELPPGGYFLAAYRDSDGGGSTSAVDVDDAEPRGFYTLAGGAASQEGDPDAVTLASGGTANGVDVTLFDYPYFASNSVTLERHTFPATGLPPGFPNKEVLFVSATPSFLPGNNQIDQVFVTGPGLLDDAPGVLKDDGILPDQAAGDGMWSGWVEISGGVNNGTYEVTALDATNELPGQANADLSGTALPIPNTTAPVALASSVTPEFQWDDVNGATDYGLILLDEANPTQFSQLDFIKDDLTSSAYQLSGGDLTLQENGTYYWFVQAFSIDDQNLSFSSFKMFAVDTTKPGVSQVDLSLDPPLAAGDVKITVTFDSLMDAATAPTVSYGGNAVPGGFLDVQNGASTLWEGTALISAGNDGNQTLSISGGKDLAGNTMETDTSTTFVIDTTKPTVQSVATSPMSPVKAGETTFTITFDEIMNIGAPLTVTFGDPAKPVDGDFLIQDTKTWVGSYNVVAGYDGPQTISVSGGQDIAGNEMDADTSGTFTVDTTAPVTTPDIPAATYGAAQNVNLSAGDASSTTTYYRLYVDTAPGTAPTVQDITTEGTGPIALADAGPTSIKNYYLYWYSTDAAGNVEGVQNAAYVIDRNAPSTLATFSDPQPTPYGGQYYTTSTNVVVTLSSPTPAQPDDTVTIYYTTDGSVPSESSLNFPDGTGDLPPFTTEGAHTVKYFAKNDLGLEEQPKTLIVNIDTTPPAAPTLNTVATPTNQTPQSIGGTKDADTAIFLSGVAEAIVSASSSTNWSYNLALVETNNPISLTAKDPAGNVSTATTSAIVLDTNAPTTASHNPAKGSVDQALNTPVVVTIQDVGVGVDTASIVLNVDGTAYSGAALNIDDANPNSVVVSYTPQAIYPATTEIPVTVDAADLAGNALAQDVYAFTTGDTVGVSPASAGVARGAEITLIATGGSLDYSWSQLVNATVTPSVDTKTATFSATVNGTYTVTVTDAASATDSAQLTVVDPVDVTGAASIESAGSTTFTAKGGAKNDPAPYYVWTASEGDITADGVFIAPEVASGSVEVDITATDATYAGVADTVTIRVFAEMAVDNPPADDAFVELSGNSAEFTVSGGDNTLYTWDLLDPDGVAVPGQTKTGATYSFTAPADRAGLYTVRVTDNQGFVDTFTISIPVGIAPAKKSFTEVKLDESANPQTFTVTGTDGTHSWEVLDAADATGEVADPSAYGTWAGDVFSPADVSSVMKFYARLTVANDGDLTEGNGLNTRVAGPFTIIPVDRFTVGVTETNGTPIPGATVNVDYTDPNTGTDVAGKQTDANSGEATFTLPDAGGTYSYTAAKDGFIPGAASSTAKSLTIALEGTGDAIQGTVTDTAGNAISGAEVKAYQPSAPNTLYRATTDNAGAYAINLPVGAPGSGYTVVAGKSTAPKYVSRKREGIVAGATDADFTQAAGTGLQLKTTITFAATLPGDGTVAIDITADPAFSAGDGSEASVAKTSTTGSGTVSISGEADGTVRAVYSIIEPFTVVIGADTSGDNKPDPTVGDQYAASLVFSYAPTAVADTSGDADASGGSTTLTSAGQTSAATVPVEGVTKNASIAIRQVTKATPGAKTTQASPTYVYEVTAYDGATGDELADTDISRVEITIPLDLSVVSPGDLENGVYRIYHAATLAELEDTGGVAVPVNQIISSDYVGDGTIGSVTFWVDDLSVFGVGLPIGGGSTSSSGGGGGGGCFIMTAAQDKAAPKAGVGAVAVVMAAALGLAFTVIRRKK